MIGAPLALLGLLAVAVPVIIHLFGRHRSRIERFPTLRFIGTSRLNPTSRRRISDLPLLLVRMAIVAIAAVALSQPFVTCGNRTPEASGREANRVVIVDTSASMFRLTPSGRPAIVAARAQLVSLGDGTPRATIETADPETAIEGAVAWLATQPGARELAIVSDFQRSSIDTAALRLVPPDFGIKPVPIPVTTTDLPRVRTDPTISSYVGAAETSGADAAWRAAGRVRPVDTTGQVAIIYRSAPGADSLLRQATPIDSGWMARVVASMLRDPVLTAAGGGLDTVGGRGPLHYGRDGSRLLLFVRNDASSLPSAALIQALIQALPSSFPGSEADPSVISSAELAAFQREPRPTTIAATDASDARWFWLACLLLIGLESLLRRRERRPTAAVPATIDVRERAA